MEQGINFYNEDNESGEEYGDYYEEEASPEASAPLKHGEFGYEGTVSYGAMLDIILPIMNKKDNRMGYCNQVLTFILAKKAIIDMNADDSPDSLAEARYAIAVNTPMEAYYRSINQKVLKPDDVESLLSKGQEFSYAVGIGPALNVFDIEEIKNTAKEKNILAKVPNDFIKHMQSDLLARAFVHYSKFYYTFRRLKIPFPRGFWKVISDNPTNTPDDLKVLRTKLYQYFKTNNFSKYEPQKLMVALSKFYKSTNRKESSGLKLKCQQMFEKLVPTPYFPQTKKVVSEIWSFLGKPINCTKVDVHTSIRPDISVFNSVEEIIQCLSQYGKDSVLLSKGSLNDKLTCEGKDTKNLSIFYVIDALIRNNYRVHIFDSPNSYTITTSDFFVSGQVILDYSNMLGVYSLQRGKPKRNRSSFMSSRHVNALVAKMFEYQQHVLEILFSNPIAANNLYFSLLANDKFKTSVITLIGSSRSNTKEDDVEESFFSKANISIAPPPSSVRGPSKNPVNRRPSRPRKKVYADVTRSENDIGRQQGDTASDKVKDGKPPKNKAQASRSISDRVAMMNKRAQQNVGTNPPTGQANDVGDISLKEFFDSSEEDPPSETARSEDGEEELSDGWD
jgi:hypothetical protein